MKEVYTLTIFLFVAFLKRLRAPLNVQTSNGRTPQVWPGKNALLGFLTGRYAITSEQKTDAEVKADSWWKFGTWQFSRFEI